MPFDVEEAFKNDDGEPTVKMLSEGRNEALNEEVNFHRGWRLATIKEQTGKNRMEACFL